MATGLSRKILLPLILVISCSLVAILFISQKKSTAVIHSELLKNLQRETAFTSKMLDNWLTARQTDISTWSLQQIFQQLLDQEHPDGPASMETASEVLHNLEIGYPYYDFIFVADLEGKIRAGSKKSIPADITIADRSYFQQTVGGKNTLSDILTNRLTGETIFAVAAPIYSQGSIVGIMCGSIPLAYLSSLFIDDFQLSAHSYAALYNKQGKIFAHSQNESDHTLQTSAPFVRKYILGSAQGYFVYSVEHSSSLISYQKLKQQQWYFCIIQSIDESLAPLHHALLFSSLAGLIILIMVSIIVIVLVRMLITSRLRAILSGIDQVSSGNFSQTLDVHVHQDDEITEITKDFNTMITRLDSTINQLNREIEERKKAETNLEQHKANLEATIQQRGQELEAEIQQRKETEKRLARAERLEMIGTLAGGVAHDLNNILSGVVSYPDLLLMQTDPKSSLYKPLKIIQEAGQRASAIVQDLLTLARRGLPVKELLNLNTLIEQYLESPEFLDLMRHHKQTVVLTELAADLLPMEGSPVHLAKTIMNLVTNSVEAMPSGGQVKISTDNCYIDTSINTLYETVGEGSYVLLQVSDQGEGIAPKDLEKIFEPFYTSKKTGKSGTGLGMAVVWGAVKDHNGYISCDSVLNKGTEFTLFLPATTVLLQKKKQADTPISLEGKGEHILVIDDVQEQRELGTAILTSLGYLVTTAASGEEGIEKAEHTQFDLVLLDMILGEGLDGLDTYKAILDIHPHQRAIITSGYSESSRIKETLKLGAGKYIKKPFVIQSLGFAIRQELDRG